MELLKAKRAAPLVALVIANVIPLGGVLFAGWDAAKVVLLYWTENLIIGFYNVLRMATLRMERPAFHLAKLLAIPFFCVHYGGFCAGHGFFLLFLFKLGGEGHSLFPDTEWAGPLVFLQLLVAVVRQLWISAPKEMLWPFLALVASHGISFVHNHLARAESATLSIGELMARPYKRIVVMHIAIILGAFFIMALNSPLPLLIVLVLLKCAIDLHLHRKEHAPVRQEDSPGGTEKRTESLRT